MHVLMMTKQCCNNVMKRSSTSLAIQEIKQTKLTIPSKSNITKYQEDEVYYLTTNHPLLFVIQL